MDLWCNPSIWYVMITTWQILFEEIQREQLIIIDLLVLMSMCDQQGISKNLVCDNGQDILDFHNVLILLINYSLIRGGADGQIFNLY